MTFNTTDLLPKMPRIPVKQASFRLPLTPFFNDETRLGSTHTRGFRGNDFFRQYKTSGPFVSNDDAEIFCGYAAYRKFTSTDLDDDASFKWTGSRTRSYHFDTDSNTASVRTDTDGNPTIGNIWPNSPTTATQGKADNDPPDHIEITLSEEVDKDWLNGELSRWLAMPAQFIEATGNGLGTYAFIGQGATKSESDGWLAIVGGGRCQAHGPWFSGTPFGMVGNEGEKWNGNFSTFISKVTRKNAPCLYQESGIRSDGVVIAPQFNPLAVGRSIYRQGYSELELSEQVGHLWSDAFGVFEDATILAGFPMSPTHAFSLSSLLNYHREGEANELTLISRTGKRYRVTLQAGYSNYEYDEDDWEAEPVVTWVTVQSFVLMTDNSLMATTSVAEIQDAWEIRVARIEEEASINGQLQWTVVADADAYEQYVEDLQNWQQAWNAWNQGGRVGDAPVKPPVMRDPQQLIGPSVTGKFLLLATMKLRRGSRFGFYPFTYAPSTANDRYRKKTFKMHLTPGSVEPYEGGCGLSDLSGNVDYEWSEEYDIQSGLLLPRELQQWTASLNGVDWTQETPLDFELTSFPGSSWAEQSATRQRREGSHTWVGKFLVGFDSPDSRGRIVSTNWVSAGMTINGTTNRTGNISLTPPSSGHSLFFGGHRLTYPASE
jgi:hypothetical protein